MKARWYDPQAGRFLSVDPVIRDVAHPQSHNGYSYVENNPVNRFDPEGLQGIGPEPPPPDSCEENPLCDPEGLQGIDPEPAPPGSCEENPLCSIVILDPFATKEVVINDWWVTISLADPLAWGLASDPIAGAVLRAQLRAIINDLVPDNVAIGGMGQAFPGLVAGLDLEFDTSDIFSPKLTNLDLRGGFGAGGSFSIRSIGVVTPFGGPQGRGPQLPVQLGALLAGGLLGVGGVLDVRVPLDFQGPASVVGGVGYVQGGLVCAPCVTVVVIGE